MSARRGTAYVQGQLSPTQWYALHYMAGRVSPLGVRKTNTHTYGVLHRLKLINLERYEVDWTATEAGLAMIAQLAEERARLAGVTLTSHSSPGSVRGMAKDIKPGRVSAQVPVTMTGPMHDAIDAVAKEFGVSRSKVVVDCVDDALVRVRRRYGQSLLTRAAG